MYKPRKLLFVILLALAAANLAARQRNVLLVTIDTWRFDRLGLNLPTGFATPNLDRLGRRGANFSRAFAHTPLTLPSHCNIMTGVTPLFHGVSDNSHFQLGASFLTLAEHLKQAGFQTAAFVGAFVLNRVFGLDQGFDVYAQPERNEDRADAVVDRALAWLNDRDGRWFCWIHLWDAHTPYEPPEPFKSNYPHDPYSGEVAYVDAQLGRVFALLEKRGALADTLLVVTGDHGESLGEHGEYEHGYFCYNSTIHVPLLICAADVSPATIRSAVSHVDIFPTVCDLLAVSKPGHLQGRSLLPLLNGAADQEKPIYIEAKQAYLTKGWAPLEGWIFAGRKYIKLPIPELYELESDAGENRNAISRFRLSDLNGTLRKLKAQLTGTASAESRATLSQEALRKLRTFGYLAGVKQEEKSVFGRADDLKVLLPIQNKLRQAEKLLNEQRYEAAAAVFTDVLGSKPDNIGTYVLLAEALQRLGRHENAEKILRQGLKRKPDNIELQCALGMTLAELNRSDEALAVLKQVLAREDFNADAWNYLGVVHFKRREFALARQAYDRSLRINPGNAQLQNNLGTLLLTLFVIRKETALREQAGACFDRAIDIEPKLAAAWNGRASARLFAGQPAAAIQDWRQAIRLQPDLVDAYFNIANAALRTGNHVMAAEFLNTLKLKYAQRLSAQDHMQMERLLAEAATRASGAATNNGVQ